MGCMLAAASPVLQTRRAALRNLSPHVIATPRDLHPAVAPWGPHTQAPSALTQQPLLYRPLLALPCLCLWRAFCPRWPHLWNDLACSSAHRAYMSAAMKP